MMTRRYQRLQKTLQIMSVLGGGIRVQPTPFPHQKMRDSS